MLLALFTALSLLSSAHATVTPCMPVDIAINKACGTSKGDRDTVDKVIETCNKYAVLIEDHDRTFGTLAPLCESTGGERLKACFNDMRKVVDEYNKVAAEVMKAGIGSGSSACKDQATQLYGNLKRCAEEGAKTVNEKIQELDARKK